jgi:hypothetical protein
MKLDFWLHVTGDEEKPEIERADPKGTVTGYQLSMGCTCALYVIHTLKWSWKSLASALFAGRGC